jgi:hypothetical protein
MERDLVPSQKRPDSPDADADAPSETAPADETDEELP